MVYSPYETVSHFFEAQNFIRFKNQTCLSISFSKSSLNSTHHHLQICWRDLSNGIISLWTYPGPLGQKQREQIGSQFFRARWRPRPPWKRAIYILITPFDNGQALSPLILRRKKGKCWEKRKKVNFARKQDREKGNVHFFDNVPFSVSLCSF